MKVVKNLSTAIKTAQDELNRVQLFLDLLMCIQDSGFTVEALAEEAGVAPATLYFWLTGHVKKPRIDTVHKVAHALGFDLRLYRVRRVVPSANRKRMKVIKGGKV